MGDVSLMLVVAFAGGVIAPLVRVPPLVGFLAAGFALNLLDVPRYDALDVLADLGVTLLLFAIGLKLDLRSLLRREVWLTTSTHMAATSVVGAAFLGGLGLLGLGVAADADLPTLLLVGFALSFSSTVFAIKLLEERNSLDSLHGRTAIGILVLQDLAAVVFLAWTEGEPPSPWAVLILVLALPGGWVLRQVLQRMERGEMLLLFGAVVALVPGYALFDAVGLKGDVGALVMGALLAPHPKSVELARGLFGIKELLLVAFFVAVGFSIDPAGDVVAIAALLLLLVPLKAVGFVLLARSQRLRTRSAVMTAVTLGNYSEFSLIVIAAGVSADLLDNTWLSVGATAVAASFVISAILGRYSEPLVGLTKRVAPDHRTPEELHPDDRPIDVGHAHAVVLGMGRVGQAAYEQLASVYGLSVVGVENAPSRADRLRQRGFEVVSGDATDPEFWARLKRTGEVRLAVLAMPFHDSNRQAMARLDASDFGGTVAAIAQYDDQIDELVRLGADAAFQLYDGAGVELAERATEAAGITPPQE